MINELPISTSKKNGIIDITHKVSDIVKKSSIKEGLCIVYCTHTTAAITINENADPNMQEDVIKAINKIVPEHDSYLHDKLDNNAAAHIKSSLIGNSVTIPISNNILQLGKWQDIWFVECDGSKERKVLIKLISG